MPVLLEAAWAACRAPRQWWERTELMRFGVATVFCLLGLMAAAPAWGAAPGLVAAYGFDEGSGTTATDASGNGRTGAVTGATWAAGRYGGALSFDGTNDYVVVDGNRIGVLEDNRPTLNPFRAVAGTLNDPSTFRNSVTAPPLECAMRYRQDPIRRVCKTLVRLSRDKILEPGEETDHPGKDSCPIPNDGRSTQPMTPERPRSMLPITYSTRMADTPSRARTSMSNASRMNVSYFAAISKKMNCAASRLSICNRLCDRLVAGLCRIPLIAMLE